MTKQDNNTQPPADSALPLESFEVAGMVHSDVVARSPDFATASLMIGSAQSQARAMAAEVTALQQFMIVGLTTASQNVVRLLDEPSLSQKRLDALLAANET